MNIKPVAFTVSFNTKVGVLKTPIGIYTTPKFNPSFKPLKKVYTALWDTGSNITVISTELANKLNLDSVGEMHVDTANGHVVMNRYIVSLNLPNHLNIENIMISSGKLGEGVDILIGMDIITLGDFSITNFNNKTKFTFRFPSIQEIDFVKEIDN